MKRHLSLIFILACILFSCKPDPVSPTVTTKAVTAITGNSAMSGGEVIDDGGADISARGVCWSKNQNPTVNDSRTNDGGGMGTFTSIVSDIEDSTTYFLRAYAVNSAGVSYGDVLSFMTLDLDENPEDPEDDGDEDNEILLPTVSTLSIDSVTCTAAFVSSGVVSDGGAEVTTYGVCWSVNHYPTICHNHTRDGKGVGEFTSEITELYPNKTYYVRAYATNEKGTAYGEELSFTTLEEIIIELPEVRTVSVTEITHNSAVVTGEVVSDGGAEVTSRGFVWNRCHIEDDSPIEDYNVEVDAGTGTFTYTLSGLLPNTEYWVYAYAVNSEGRTTGEHHYFTTQDDGTINGYEYVDLGLPSGLKWAAHNVGADSPSETGDYFAWGELEPKAEYIETNCISYGVNLPDISGDSQYDAASANWGASWRLPTREEMQELRDNCVWEWNTLDGISGFTITGPNGNHIFLPAAGFISSTTCYFLDLYGYYWTSFPGTENDYGSFSLCFGIDAIDIAWYFRHAGLTIRPVSD